MNGPGNLTVNGTRGGKTLEKDEIRKKQMRANGARETYPEITPRGAKLVKVGGEPLFLRGATQNPILAQWVHTTQEKEWSGGPSRNPPPEVSWERARPE